MSYLNLFFILYWGYIFNISPFYKYKSGDLMSKEKQTQDALLEAIDIAVENKLKKLGFNYYVDGVIKSKNIDNTYDVLINGTIYKKVPSKNNFEYSVNDVVQVLIKNGNWNKKFIDDVSRHNNSVSEKIRNELTKDNVIDALGYTPPEQDTNTTYSDRDFVKSNDVYGQDSPNHTLRMGWSGSKFLLAVDHNGGLQPNTSNPTGEVHQMYQKDDILNLVYPIGSIYMSVNNVSPAIFLGGTWEVWGSGKVPVGVNTSETEFNSVEKTGGAKTHKLTTAQMPNHTHTLTPSGTISDTSLTPSGSISTKSLTGEFWNMVTQSSATDMSANGIFTSKIHDNKAPHPSNTSYTEGNKDAVGIDASHNHTFTGTSASHNHTFTGTQGTTSESGSGSAHNNLQPYITCYMWKRVS